MIGTHMPSWLTDPTWPVPLFISRERLDYKRRWPHAAVPWCMDSGGFTQLQRFGTWTLTAAEYVTEVRRIIDGVGVMPQWIAPQDWMCERAVIDGGQMGPMRFAGTHLSVAEHQRRTVANGIELRDLAPDLPWIYVVQGDDLPSYLRCIDMYTKAGVDLTTEPVVGLGSVCRRQATAEIGGIVGTLADLGLRLHGFGCKKEGIARYGGDLHSADSMAWSLRGRHVPGCSPSHKNEANCKTFAKRWLRELLTRNTYEQSSLFGRTA